MHVATANGNKCVLTFINDYSIMCWVYLLSNKSQVFDVFKKFHLMIKNETQQNIGILKIDNGGEYTSHVFEQYSRTMESNIRLPYLITHNRMTSQNI